MKSPPLPSSGPISPTPGVSPAATCDPNPRKRTRTACTRCKNRKQKCDDQFPICFNCLRVGAECDKADVANEAFPVAYTKALEEHVALLETLLTESGLPRAERERRLESLRAHHSTTPVTGEAGNVPAAASAFSPSGVDRDGNEIDSGATNHQSALHEVVRNFSQGNFEAPAYIGSSSGLSLAMNLGEIVQATVWKKAIPEIQDQVEQMTASSLVESPDQRSSTSTRHGSTHLRAMTLAELVRLSVKEPPNDGLGSRLIDVYFHQLHPRYPFLNRTDIWEFHQERIEMSKIPPVNLSQSQRFGLFRLYMLYAIGATLLQLLDARSTVSPESFYTTALQHMAAAKELRTIENIEAMTLLVLYHLRSASAHGLWYMIGLAMRSCIDLGLHRKGHEQSLAPVMIQWRRRLFWSVYSLERTIAISLGRPLCILDRQIDVDLPSATLEPEVHSTLPPRLSPGDAPQGPARSRLQGSNGSENIEVGIFLFRLRRLESQIHHSIYRTDRPLSTLRSKLDKHRHALEAWHTSLLAALPTGSPLLHYPLLQYNRALRLLIQPFLTLLPPSDSYFTLCLHAAGNICQAHKRLQQTLDYGHSFMAVQTVFTSGVIILYCLWTHGYQIWTIALANDIRACSLVLFVMGERAPWVRKYRDAFEILVNAAMEKLQNGNSRLAEMAAAAQENHIRTQNDQWNGVGQQQRQQTGASYNVYESGGDSSRSQEFDPSQCWPPRGPFSGEQHQEEDAWRVVQELAAWIDQDQGEATTPIWMPNFDDLQQL